MRQLTILAIILIGIVTIKCGTPKEVPPPTAKQLSPENIKGYHNPMNMQIAWSQVG